MLLLLLLAVLTIAVAAAAAATEHIAHSLCELSCFGKYCSIYICTPVFSDSPYLNLSHRHCILNAKKIHVCDLH